MKIKKRNKRLVKKLKNREENSKGITLIALIITIILLIILAGVVITLIVGEKGIFKTGQKSVTDYKEKEAREKLELVLLDLQADKQVNMEYNEYEYIDNRITAEGMQVSGDIVTVNRWKFEIDRSIPQIKNNLGESDNTEENDNAEENDVILEYSAKSTISKQIPMTLKDNSEKSVDANLVNAEYNSEKTGIVFNGTSTYSQLDSSQLNIGLPATVSMAVNLENDTSQDNNIIFSDKNSQIGIGTWQNKQLIVTINVKSYYYNLPSDFYNDTIHYITVAYGDTITDNRVYIDGNEIAKNSTTGCWSRSEANSYIGRRASGGYLKGTLYDLELYNKTFSEEEILSQYQLDKNWLENNQNKVNNNQENLILSYYVKGNANNMEKDIPGTLKDLTGTGVDANLENAEYNSEKTGIVFNGTSTYSQLDSSKLNITFPTTITIAVKWENINDQLIFIDTNSRIGIGTYNGELLLSAIESSQYYALPSDFTTKEINYLTVIYNTSATDNDVYLDGVKLTKSTSTDAWKRSESGTYLGRRQSGSYFKGILYKFKIYSKMFSQEEVLSEYNKDKEYFENN